MARCICSFSVQFVLLLWEKYDGFGFSYNIAIMNGTRSFEWLDSIRLNRLVKRIAVVVAAAAATTTHKTKLRISSLCYRILLFFYASKETMRGNCEIEIETVLLGFPVYITFYKYIKIE